MQTTTIARNARWDTDVLALAMADPTPEVVADAIAWVEARGSKVQSRTAKLLALLGTEAPQVDVPEVKVAPATPKAENAAVAYVKALVAEAASGKPEAIKELNLLCRIRTGNKVRVFRGTGFQDALKGVYRLRHLDGTLPQGVRATKAQVSRWLALTA